MNVRSAGCRRRAVFARGRRRRRCATSSRIRCCDVNADVRLRVAATREAIRAEMRRYVAVRTGAFADACRVGRRNLRSVTEIEEPIIARYGSELGSVLIRDRHRCPCDPRVAVGARIDPTTNSILVAIGQVARKVVVVTDRMRYLTLCLRDTRDGAATLAGNTARCRALPASASTVRISPACIGSVARTAASGGKRAGVGRILSVTAKGA